MKTCPRCGHVNRQDALWCEMCQKGLTFWGLMSEPWGKTGIPSRISMTWALLTAAGCLWLFLFPPLGICLLIVSPFIRTVPKKAVPGVCPHCGKDTGAILPPDADHEFPCPGCGKLIVIEKSCGRPVFEKASSHIIPATASLAGDPDLSDGSPSQKDHLATQVDGSPAIGNGKSFRTHKLVLKANDRLEFKATMKALCVALVPLVVGLSLIISSTIDRFVPWLAEGADVGGFVIGLLFTFAGLVMVYAISTPVVFDLKKNTLYIGWGVSSQGDLSRSTAVPLDRIHGTQIITDVVHGRKGPYEIHALYLVLNNGNRIRVAGESDLDEVRHNAEEISRFLGIHVFERGANQAL